MRYSRFCLLNVLYIVFGMILLLVEAEVAKEEMDIVIEDEITQKLSEDLLQSIERKFQVDLERSVDSVLVKIKLLLRNGTTHIQDKLAELQGVVEAMKKRSSNEVDACLALKENKTSALAEKTLHQMVVCGYALIGHDPAQAVKDVLDLKNMIRDELKPIYQQKKEVYSLLKLCGHDHDNLKKVVKCVISKSPPIKTAMMGISSKLIDGVVRITKLMAHGAMHEACLIEVLKTVEDEAFEILREVKNCATQPGEVENYLNEDNATVVEPKNKKDADIEVKDMKDLLRRMLADSDGKHLDKNMKEKFLKLQKDLDFDKNVVANNILNKE